MANEETLRSLTAKRGLIKSKVTRFSNYLEVVKQTNDTKQLKLRYKTFETCLSEFEDIQSQIDLLSDKHDENESEREHFENQYYELASTAEHYLNLNNINDTPSGSSRTSTENSQTHPLIPSSTIKLPAIKLPSFTGNYEDWLPFHDLFTSLVHNNTTLTDVEKFHYLKTSLDERVRPILVSLEASSQNYSTAWTLLKERYDNKRIIVNKHIGSLINIESASRESASCLRNFLDSINKHVRCLSSLGQPVEKWDSILIHILSKKLDQFTLRHWENQNTSKEVPTMDSFIQFLQNRCQVLESLNDTKTDRKPSNSAHTHPNFPLKHSNKFNSTNISKGHGQAPSFSHVATHNQCCLCSNAHHRLYSCSRFLAKSPTERLSLAKTHNLCTNCLSQGHSNINCPSGSCKICSKKHNTLLHCNTSQTVQSQQFNSKPKVNTSQQQNTSDNVLLSSQSTSTTHQVLLPTAVVYVTDKNGSKLPCRALLDSGSQTNFITNRMVKILNLKKSANYINICGINQTPSQSIGAVSLTIQSRCTNFQKHMEFQVVPTITQDMPNIPIDIASWNLPPWVKLSDPNLGTRSKIDMLIGGEIFYELLCVGQFTPALGAPTLQKTLLGWVAGGKVVCPHSNTGQQMCFLTMKDDLLTQVRKFWEIEEVDGHRSSSEGILCENHYIQTTKRDSSGRYCVSLPLRDNITDLGESYDHAVARLETTERKLKKNTQLRSRYNEFIDEYISLNHMEPISTESSPSNNIKPYYLPHLPVVRESSSTTKLRVVFDASAKTTTGISLNEAMRVGPTIQADLFSTICNFRTHKYAMTADITKMYRQILLNEDQRDLQRILWRFNPDDEIKIYRLNTVTYGMAAAPFLAIRTLHKLADDEGQHFPAAARVLKEDFYVDDLMTGANSITEAIKLQNEIISLLKAGGFELRKWSANHPDILQSIPVPSRENTSGSIVDSNHSVKVLGMLWNPNDDFFHFVVSKSNLQFVTKRTILSDVAGLFDPLGLVSPVIVTAKIFLQKLWALKLGWDESIPQNMCASWKQYRNELYNIEQLHIPRQVVSDLSGQVTLHGFCDASEMAYGACIYARQEYSTGEVRVTLLCSKSRVAPVKQQTIPKLELCGALLLSKLVDKVNSTKLNNYTCTLWSDSSIVLAWIRSEPSTWKIFVSNRVQEINRLTSHCKWRHVSSKDNPADLISRGLMPGQITNNDIWWHGPKWLQQPHNTWPVYQEKDMEIPEKRKSSTATPTTSALTSQVNYTNTLIDTNNFSALSKLQRTTAYCLRFIHNCRFPSNRNKGPLTSTELIDALNYLIKEDQNIHLSHEIKIVRSGKPTLKSSLISLQPFLDKQGLLRVGGRLENASIETDQKHPIILPAKSHLTDLIIQNEHKRTLHSGPQLLLATLRQRFWPIGGRNSTRKIVRQCIDCFKAKPTNTQPPMGNIPASRLKQSRPFTSTGVDYCGPIFIKSSKLRSAKLIKAYIAVFVCFSTKAIHLELVSDLTTEAFLAAFRRFISRRGLCRDIYSDNGTNFVGAYKEIQELRKLLQSQEHQHEIIDATSAHNITWHFIPPQSPHFGGLWEAGVKSVKHHLKRVVKNAHLTFEQFYTVLTMIEACLNSRPITSLSDNSSDPQPLTPGHFLIGEALTAIPEPDITHLNDNRLSQWQRCQQILQHFWRRWSTEYLSLLQQRQKWASGPENNLQPGQIVLLKEDNLPPLKWLPAVIVEVYPGVDGRARVASVKTSAGIYKRAVNKLCPLPLEQ